MAEVQALVTKPHSAIPAGLPGLISTTFSVDFGGIGNAGGYFFGNLDAYINVVGGLRLDEPAADLPVALALVSNLTDRVIAEDVVAFGEVEGWLEIRAVSRVQSRVNRGLPAGVPQDHSAPCVDEAA